MKVAHCGVNRPIVRFECQKWFEIICKEIECSSFVFIDRLMELVFAAENRNAKLSVARNTTSALNNVFVNQMTQKLLKPSLADRKPLQYGVFILIKLLI